MQVTLWQTLWESYNTMMQLPVLAMMMWLVIMLFVLLCRYKQTKKLIIMNLKKILNG